jgi:hypothetical protein
MRVYITGVMQNPAMMQQVMGMMGGGGGNCHICNCHTCNCLDSRAITFAYACTDILCECSIMIVFAILMQCIF